MRVTSTVGANRRFHHENFCMSGILGPERCVSSLAGESRGVRELLVLLVSWPLLGVFGGIVEEE